MLGKKGEDKEPSKEELLVKRVDAMMDPKATQNPAPVSPAKSAEPSAATPPPLDIFKETKTAPEVPGIKPVKEPSIQPKPVVKDQTEPDKPVIEDMPATSAPANDTATMQPAEINEANPEIDNKDTDKAVEDIVAHEGDVVLAAEDAAAKKTTSGSKPTQESGFKAKLKRILKNKKTWAIVAAILVVLFAIPQTRYTILGLVIKRQVTVVVMDSKTATPVSSAQVNLAGKQVKTDANGKALIKAGLGQSTLKISKQYYKSYSQKFFVGFKTSKSTEVKLVATGRQVPITVINKITGKPVANAEVKVLNTTAKTDKKGKAVVVLPATAVSNAGIVTASGYNLTKVIVQVTSQVVKQNTFEITPTGHVYFLSNSSGKIDVVKTNLDGTGRQVVLAGTGKEDGATTNLLASRDWRYVALKSKREGTRPVLYLIDTSNDKVTEFDGNNADFNLIGWYGHDFMYSSISNTVVQSQSGHQAVKSYNAEKQQLNQLDQTQSEGNPSSYAYQSFDNFYILNNLLTYSVQWSTYDATGNGVSLAGKNDAIRGVEPDGQNKKDYKTFPAEGVGYIQAALYAPQNVYYAVYGNNNAKIAYYDFSNQSVSTSNTIDQSDITKTYPTYLVSPNGNQTFWADVRDGKNTFFIGDTNAKNPKQITSAGEYAPYGWYGDNYVLVSKGKSQLYIMPVNSDPNRQPLKVTDYYKPAATFTGYGYGYGGL